MAAWGWARLTPFMRGDEAYARLPRLKRWHDEIAARPPAILAVALKETLVFKATMNEEVRTVMFKHLAA